VIFGGLWDLLFKKMTTLQNCNSCNKEKECMKVTWDLGEEETLCQDCFIKKDFKDANRYS